MGAKCCSKKIVFGVLTVIFIVLLIVSIVLIEKIIPDVIESEVDKNTRLENGTEQYDRFLELPFPIKFKVYIFNVDNAEDVMNNGAIPELTEIGPYVYDQYRKKDDNLTINYEDDTISYSQMENFTFNQIESGDLTEEDMVTVYNAPLMMILQQVSSSVDRYSDCILETFPTDDKKKVFISINVRDYLLNGVEFCIKPNGMCGSACSLAATFKNVDPIDIEDKSLGLKFSLFHYKEKMNDGVYTVKMGLKDIKTVGHITKLNGETSTKIWDTKTSTPCDEVKGTDSTLYPPRVQSDETFQIYSTDICRYVEIFYKGEGSYAGIDGYKFAVDSETLQSSTQNKEDDCFCVQKVKDVNGYNSCYLDGVIDLMPCFGPSVLLSFPHFLWANSSYTSDYKDGTFTPDESKHETYLLVEPNTGTPLEGMKRIQINAVLRPIENLKHWTVPYTEKLPRIIVPLVWIEEGVSLTDEYVDKLNSMYFDKVKIADIAKWTFLGVSSAASLVFGGLFLYYFFFK